MSAQTELERRLALLEDRAALEDLVRTYFLAADQDDLGTVARCFAADGSFAVSGQVTGATRAAVVDFIATQRRSMGLTVHSPNALLFSIPGGDEASGTIGAHLEMALNGEAIYGAVRYIDTYVRRENRWQIATRDMRVVFVAPWVRVGEALLSPVPVRWPGLAPSATDLPRREEA